MELIAWKAAQMWIKSSRSESAINLPTPHQFGIALKSASTPGIFSILSFLPYLFSKKRASLPPILMLLLSTMILQVAIGWAVAATDTWLHLTSTTVLKTQSAALSSISTSYSRILPSNCTSGSMAYVSENSSPLNQPCSLNIAATNVWILGIVEGLSTLNNISATNAVHVHSDGTAFVKEAHPIEALDFTASTVGMKSTCTPISSACNFGEGKFGASTPYNCRDLYPNVRGDLGGVFNLTIVSPEGDWKPKGTGLNPFHASVSILVDTALAGDDSEFITPVHGNRAILLWCEFEIRDVVYSVANGDITIAKSSKASNITTYPLSGPLGSQVSSMSQTLWLSAEIDAFSGNSTEFSLLFSKDISRITMGIAAGILVNSPTLTETIRTSVLAARVPKAPMAALVAILLAYFLLNISFVFICLCLIGSKDSAGFRITTQELDIIKARLHDPLGVIQECFGNGDRRLPGVTAKQMFEDAADGVLRVRPLRDMSGKAIVLERGREEIQSESFAQRKSNYIIGTSGISNVG